jgi:hypothetical protein
MKRIATTAGLLAMGAASMHAIYAPELTRLETGKPWTVAASLRGFYDSNWALQPSSFPGSKSSWGFEARPYIAVNLPMEQSYLGISYLNSSRWYEARSNDQWDFSNQVDAKFDHQFSPRYRLKVNDSFLYAMDPDVTADGIVTLPMRSDQSYLRNLANVNFTGELTRELGFSITYNNTFYDYLDSGPNSYAASLNRVVQQIPIDLRWQAQPDLVALIGYAYGVYDYTGGSTIDQGLPSDSRDAQNHTIYVGGDYDITAQWRASLRVGAQYNMYDNFDSQNEWTPYLDLYLSYFYTVGSHVDLGIKHTMAATDITGANVDGVPTLSQEATAIYLMVSHQFTPKVTANVLVQYQYSTFTGGLYDDNTQNLVFMNLYGSYRLNQFLSLEAGYNYSWLDSPVNTEGVALQSYDRSLVYLGVRAQY